jgi:hypothetical protein
MRKLTTLLCVLAFSTQAWALSTKDLLSTIAMPLAVAAVSNAAGNDSRLADLVTALNQADVQPTQFVEVIRYVPVAIDQPQFVQFVQTQASQGVSGDALVNAIVDRLRSDYNVTPTLALNGEPTTIVVQDNYIPTTLATTTNGDTLSAIALPLAVAAVANVSGVSQNELANLVATLNNANVPAPQVIHILRYVPVALVADNGPQFVGFVQQQTNQGVTGPALVPVVVQQLQTYYPAQQPVVIEPRPQPRPIVINQDFVPVVVANRTEELRVRPRGVEVAREHNQEGDHEHGRGRGRDEHQRVVVPVAPPMISSAPVPAPVPVTVAAPPGRGDQGRHEGDNRGGDHGGHGDHGDRGGDHGGGKGKGHGKD